MKNCYLNNNYEKNKPCKGSKAVLVSCDWCDAQLLALTTGESWWILLELHHWCRQEYQSTQGKKSYTYTEINEDARVTEMQDCWELSYNLSQKSTNSHILFQL